VAGEDVAVVVEGDEVETLARLGNVDSDCDVRVNGATLGRRDHGRASIWSRDGT
jgi:hypothetical protein